MTAESTLRDLYDRHWTALVRLAGLLLGSTDAAEEVVQDAYVAIFRRIDRFADAGDAYGYLRTSVVNGCRSVHRHRAVVHRKPVLTDLPPVQPEEVAERRQGDAQVLALLDTLPQRQREVLVLRYYADASEAEIAEVLGISRGAVKSHAHRGMNALRAVLVETDEGKGGAHGGSA